MMKTVILILTILALLLIWSKSRPVRAQADVEQRSLKGFSVTDSPYV